MADENISLIGRAARSNLGLDVKGLSALKAELGVAAKALETGLGVGIVELATGSNKLKAIWESIKWSAYARVGAAGIAVLVGAFIGLTGAIRKGIRESGILEASLARLANTKVLGDQFHTFLGSVSEARKRVGELYQFVANTKFNMSEAANASRVLTIMSNSALGGGKDLHTLGLVSKATNVPLEDLAMTIAKLNAQIRNKEDITSSIDNLRQLGVISESTAEQILLMSRSGASSNQVWNTVAASIDKVAQSASDAEPSMGELQDRYAKLRTAMAEKFGEPFLQAEREALMTSIHLTEALTPAVQKIGQMFAAATAPAESLKGKLAEMANTDFFKGLLTRLAEVGTALPAVFGAYQMVKGGVKLAKTTGGIFSRGVEQTGTVAGGFQELGASAKSIVSIKAGAQNMAVTANRLQAESVKNLAEQELFAAKAIEIRAQAEAKGLEFQAAALRNDAARTAALGAEVAALERNAVAQELNAKTAGLAARTNSAAATGSAVAAKGLNMLSGAAGVAGKALGSLLSWVTKMAGPLIVVTGITYLLTKAWDAWADAQERAKRAADIVKDTKDANEVMAEQIALLKTLDDKTKLVTQAREALSAAMEEQSKINADVNSTDSERSSIEAKVTAAKRNVRQAEAADTTKLAPGAVELERLQRQVQLHREIKELVFQAEFARATGSKQVLMLYERQRDMMKVIADAAKSRDVQPKIQSQQKAVDAAAEQRNQKQKGLLAERKSLEDALDLRKRQVTAGTRGEDPKWVESTQARIAQITATMKKLRAGSPEMKNAQEELIKVQESAEAGLADRYDAAAARAEAAGNMALAAQNRLKAAEVRSISPEEAERAAEQANQQIADMRKSADLRKIDLDTGKKILAVTSETFEAEDKIADAKKEGLAKSFARNADTKQQEIKNLLSQATSAGATGNQDLQDALTTQANDVQQELNNLTEEYGQQVDEIDKETKARKAGRDLELKAIKAGMDAQQLNNVAIVAAANGNFAQADAAIQASIKIQDAQTQLQRAIELRAKGYTEEQSKAIASSEQLLREQDRRTQATAYITNEERRLKEQELSLGSRGIKVTPGGKTGAAAREELIKMQDVDAFRQQLAKNLENMPGQTEKAAELALKSVSGDILSQQQPPGGNIVADSLTRIGGGGGVYGVVGADPQTQAMNRIAALAEEAKRVRAETFNVLDEIKKKIPGGVK